VDQKTIFASFKGAHMKHYPSDIRLRLKELSHLEGYEIEVTDLWHFNKVVYNYQIANKESDKESIERQEIVAYNRLLSQSLFSLCPGGAGPNTIRLWESLGSGAIPVVLSDRYEFPSLERMGLGSDTWGKAVIYLPEAEITSLDEQIRDLSVETQQSLQAEGQRLFTASRELSCFA
jgi:hypothetical protein